MILFCVFNINFFGEIVNKSSYLFIEKKKQKRRTSTATPGKVLSSIKKKITNLKRRVSTDKFPSKALFRDIPSPMKRVKSNHSASAASSVTVCTVLQRFPDGSRVIRLRRPDPTTQFGLYVRDDEDGMVVSRLGILKFSEKNNFLHRGDRILEVEHIPSSNLRCEGMRKLLEGRLTATIKLTDPRKGEESKS